ncbi:TPA: hypothetical protein SL629_006688 [Pseudomonas aeruginosa]|uniref:hypothetical protein n=1 Tax=Pseudomonadaceae TaxID=135621 RepID=UPI000FF11F6D|nr:MULTISPECIES: hypothetical protein [Pseudomonadaceae]MBA1264936.1 hypothetical protein [Stutzerimonas stutzeri]MDX3997725.1 hypothetical protein [Pseudomonas aeruginosa]RQA86771.1 hypothetical protein IPC475_28740 [Pseudomonas aeruginosa]TXR38143.1 hypothetical protein FVE88_16085 [Pseudomonas mendocina]HBO5588365.1 hypothetical protein [Pseudomonas aeruginosa]
MKNFAFVLAAVLGSTFSFAQASDKQLTLIPSMSVIPVIVVSPGLLTTANVQDFDGLNHAAGTFQQANKKLIDNLVKRECRITIQVIRKLDESRIYRNFGNGEGSLSCTEGDGSISDIVLGGDLVDESGALGLDLRDLKSGTKAYFLVKQTGAI